MSEGKIGENTLEYTPIMTRNEGVFDKRKLFALSPLKSALLVNDLGAAIAGFGVGLWIIGSDKMVMDNLAQSVAFLILSLTVIAFFKSYHLYSRHLIFSRKNHLVNLLKSFSFGLLTLGMIFCLFTWSDLWQTNLYAFAAGLFLAAISFLFLGRFFGNHLMDLLMSIGMAHLVVGINGLILTGDVPIILANWQVTLICFLLAAIFILISRGFLVHVVFHIWRRKSFRRQVVIVGSNEEAKKIAHHIIGRNAPFWISGILSPCDAPGLGFNINKDCLGELKELPGIVKEYEINDLIITDENIDKLTLVAILDFCTSTGIDVWFPPKLMPIIDIKLNLDMFCGLPMIKLCSQKNNWLFNKLKHALDALITLPLFIILSPLFLLIALAIKLDSRGPVFYRARAVGKNGMVFLMYKFRSMTADSSSEVHKKFVTKLIKGEIGREETNDRPLKITEDSRVTRVGKVLRKLSLDELPQLINVLMGDMSLVGPRPCLPYEFEIYEDWYKKRVSVRAGITGLWQVAGRSVVSFEDMILLDLYYIYNRSLVMDFNILFETVFVVLGKKGAY